MGEDRTPLPGTPDFQTQMILRQLEKQDDQNDRRTGELHQKIEDHTKTLDGKITLQGKEIQAELRKITNEQAGEKVRIRQNEKDIAKTEGEVQDHLRDSQLHMNCMNCRPGEKKEGEDSAVVKVLTSKAFWMGIAGAIAFLIIALLKAAGTF